VKAADDAAQFREDQFVAFDCQPRGAAELKNAVRSMQRTAAHDD
jgi:hypothetical protein